MIELQGATLGYGRHVVSEGLDIQVPEGSLTMIVGPNGCGKSTALKAMARLLKPSAGAIVLGGADIHSLGAKELARKLGLLAQQSNVPDGIRVAELVARGRFPHQSMLRRWTGDDEAAVAEAMRITGVESLSGLAVDRLSGGQRQRVWIAMVLAQETPVLLLDEPTTFLDLSHQLDIMELCRELTSQRGRTVVAVVHDLSQACRYATHLIAMRDGGVVAAGPPADVVTPELIREVFEVDAHVSYDAEAGAPVVTPLRTLRRSAAEGPAGVVERDRDPQPVPEHRP